jgi:hypothetical protein
MRGPTIPLEQAVRLQTGNTASVYGLDDRGARSLRQGRPTLNVVDFDALHLHAPEMMLRFFPPVAAVSCSARTAIARPSFRETVHLRRTASRRERFRKTRPRKVLSRALDDSSRAGFRARTLRGKLA